MPVVLEMSLLVGLPVASAYEVRGGSIGARPMVMELPRLAVAERAKENLRGAAAEERAVPAQDLPFHESDVGAAQDEHDAALAPPPVPALLEHGRQFRAGGGQPLEFVERNDEFARSLPALLDEAEGGGPVRGGVTGQ